MKQEEIQTSYLDVYNILQELYISQFVWHNLPETVNQRFLELKLFEVGQVAFFKDDVVGFACLPCQLSGQLNLYYEPTGIQVIGGNGYFNKFTNNIDSVVIFNNRVRNSPMFRIMDYAKRIWNIERTIDININAQKTPFLIKTGKKQELTLRNIYMQMEKFKPAIIIDEDMDDVSKIKVLKTDAPFISDKLEEQKRKLWNEALSYIGIKNNYSEKMERLTQDEVDAGAGFSNSNKNSKLECRREAAEKINKMFGLNITVEVYQDQEDLEKEEGEDIE